MTNLDLLKADLQKLSPANRVFVFAGFDIDPFSDGQLRQYLFSRDEMIAALSGQPVPQPTTITVTVISSNGLRVRATPPAGTILTVLPNGTKVTVFEIQDVSGWWKIADGTYKDGYISAEYAKVGSVEPEPPVVVTPPATAKVRNRLGFHILPGAPRSFLDVARRLNAAGRPIPFVLNVFVADGSSSYSAFSVAELRAAGVKTIMSRILTPDKDYHADDIGGWDHATRDGGRLYFEKYKHLITPDIASADYVQIKDLNEPGSGTGTNAWTHGILDGADAMRIKLAVYCFSVGNPGLPGDPRDDADFWTWQSTHDLLRRVKRDKHAFCLHQYAFADDWRETARPYRNRLIYPLLPPDLRDIKLWCNEFGEGWMTNAPADRSPQRYAARMRTANDELRNSPGDPDVALWTLGSGGEEWKRDLLNGILPEYERMAMETPA